MRLFLRPEAFAHVLVSTVAQDGDDDRLAPVCSLTLGDLQRGSSSSGRGYTDQKSLVTSQALSHRVSSLSRHLDVEVGEVRVVDLRHNRRRHVLQAFESVEGRIRL